MANIRYTVTIDVKNDNISTVDKAIKIYDLITIGGTDRDFVGCLLNEEQADFEVTSIEEV